jgi:ribonuclease HI
MRKRWKLPDERLFRYTGKDWLQLLLGQVDERTKARILMLLWRSWHLRNDVIHQEGRETIERSAAFLESYAIADNQVLPSAGDHKGKNPLFDTSLQISQRSTRDTCCSWTAPPPGWIKINSDASFIGRDKPGGAGAVARDCHGNVIIAACSPLPRCLDAEDAEAKAALRAMKLIGDLGHEKVILEMDCVGAVEALRSYGPNRSRMWSTYDETKLLLQNFGEFRIYHVKRESNRVADALANIARSAGSCNWSRLLPDLVNHLVTQDASVFPTSLILKKNKKIS